MLLHRCRNSRCHGWHCIFKFGIYFQCHFQNIGIFCCTKFVILSFFLTGFWSLWIKKNELCCCDDMFVPLILFSTFPLFHFSFFHYLIFPFIHFSILPPFHSSIFYSSFSHSSIFPILHVSTFSLFHISLFPHLTISTSHYFHLSILTLSFTLNCSTLPLSSLLFFHCSDLFHFFFSPSLYS